MFFEHGVVKRQTSVAAFAGHVDDPDISVHQQLLRPLQTQFILAPTQRHAKFDAEQPAKMSFAAIQLRRQLRQRTGRQFRIWNLRHELAKAFVQFVTGIFYRWR